MAELYLISNYNLLNKINFYYNVSYGHISYKDCIKETLSNEIDNNYNYNFVQKEYLKFIVSFF
jgi:hypothetical protein